MGTLIPQTKYDVLPPGTYRVRLGAVTVEDGIYGKQVVMRFDALDEEFAGRCIKAWAAAKLSGGRRPSKLYSWTSALLFGGMPLPDGYDLDTDALYKREALAVVEIIDRDGVYYNRIVQLFPCRTEQWHSEATPHGQGAGSATWEYHAGAVTAHGELAAGSPDEGECLNGLESYPGGLRGIFDPETHPEGLRGDFVEEPPW
jgi:hypothetical protein